MPSAEVCSDPAWPDQVFHYFEAENSSYHKPANEVLDPRASGLYGLTLGDPAAAEEAVTVAVVAPRDGRYGLLLRVKARINGRGRRWWTTTSRRQSSLVRENMR